MKIRVLHAFYNVSMHFQHSGLTELISQSTGKDWLARGEVALFLNSSWEACKVLTASGILAYKRVPQGRRITLEDIKQIPVHFGGARLSFEPALEERIKAKFEEIFKEKLIKLRKVSNG